MIRQRVFRFLPRENPEAELLQRHRGRGKMHLIEHDPSGAELTCHNQIDTEPSPQPLSGKTGLSFVRKVCELVDASFNQLPVESDAFSLRVVLPIK
jgi:hypothetical protein